MLKAQSKPVPTRTDNQVWNETRVEVPFDNKFDLLILGEIRFGQNVSYPVDDRIGAGFAFKPNSHISIEPSYQFIRTEPFPKKVGFEHRLALSGTYRFAYRRFIISNRGMLEERLRHPQIDALDFRYRLQVTHPINLGHREFYYLVSDEILHDWSVHAWSRNRFAAGIGKNFNDHFRGEVYYMRQNDGFTKPGDLNVVGTTLRFRTRRV
jgi:hypothetical protein